ncbi:MAG: PaaI family thioesterase [Acidimicrobiales bacterium]
MTGPPGRLRLPPNCDLALGLTCLDKSQPGTTVWSMPADERFANPVGVIQGGILAALVDTAMATSTVTWARAGGLRPLTANAELKISFLRPAPAGGTLTCTAKVVSGGRWVVFVEAEVRDDAGEAVARASSTYVLSPREGGAGG